MSVVLRLRPLHWRHRQACTDLGGACRSPSRASRAKCLCLPALPFPSALPAAGLIRAQPLAWLHLQRAENARNEDVTTLYGLPGNAVLGVMAHLERFFHKYPGMCWAILHLPGTLSVRKQSQNSRPQAVLPE